MNRRLIFVDLDGVLADFIGGVRGVFPPEMFDEAATSQYEVWNWLGMTKERFWSVIDRLGPAFWSDLKAYTWTRALWAAAQMAGDAYILTQPTPHPSCAAGKVEWIERELHTRKYLLAPHKAACARPGALLIDDCEDNCQAWRERGGVAWLFGRSWNHSRLSSNDVINGLGSIEGCIDAYASLAP